MCVFQVPKNAKQNDLEVKKLVKQIWQCVQGYMGDITFSYPSMLAQEILRVALEYPVLKDEIYCILLKQVGPTFLLLLSNLHGFVHACPRNERDRERIYFSSLFPSLFLAPAASDHTFHYYFVYFFPFYDW